MSEYAVEIERMTVKLENLFMDSGNLSMNYFVLAYLSRGNGNRKENIRLVYLDYKQPCAKQRKS